VILSIYVLCAIVVFGIFGQNKGSSVITVGITAAVATLVGYTSGLLYGFSLRVLYSGNLFGTTILIILFIYMGPVARQIDYHQAIQSILCCAYITILLVIFINYISLITFDKDT
jgi:hypothetical protein